MQTSKKCCDILALSSIGVGIFFAGVLVGRKFRWDFLKFYSKKLNDECPGLGSEEAGLSDKCKGCPNQAECASGNAESKADLHEKLTHAISEKFLNVKKVFLSMSGKGGVGKSSIAVQVAYELAERGFKVGLLDIDICGPSIPRMSNTADKDVIKLASGWQPIKVSENLKVISVGHLLNNENEAIIWRGPKKSALIKQFLIDVNWGDLDYLMIDTSPGTSDEHLSIVSYLQKINNIQAIIVTLPPKVCILDVKKQINFCHATGLKICGIVTNMVNSIFDQGLEDNILDLCKETNLPLIGCIEMSKDILSAGEHGTQLNKNSSAYPSLRALVNKII